MYSRRGLTSLQRQIVLLRGINIGARNRIAMQELRELLESAGFQDVRTYIQSGNVVLSSSAPPRRVALECEQRIAERFGLEIDVVVRTRDELSETVERDPLGKFATDPKRYQVTFLAAAPDPAVTRKLEAVAVAPERVVLIGREVYAWHPDGIARSRLWALLASPQLGVKATARNWITVTKILALSGE